MYSSDVAKLRELLGLKAPVELSLKEVAKRLSSIGIGVSNSKFLTPEFQEGTGLTVRRLGRGQPKPGPQLYLATQPINACSRREGVILAFLKGRDTFATSIGTSYSWATGSDLLVSFTKQILREVQEALAEA